MFALFAGENYYPAGGWQDLVGVFPTLEEAQAALQGLDEYSREWYQIVDLAKGEMVEEG